MVKWIVSILLVLSAAGLYWQYYSDEVPDVAAEYRYAIPNVEDIATIKISYRIIEDKILLERKEGYWELNGKYRARQDAMTNLLTAIEHMELQYIPGAAAVETMTKDLATTSTRVEILDGKGETMKAYFIGANTPDDRGSYIALAGTQKPAVVAVSGAEGSLRPRFVMPEIDWRDRIVFREKMEEIEEITVDYPANRNASFAIKNTDGEFDVFPLRDNQIVDGEKVRRGTIENYLNRYRSVGAEAIIRDLELAADLHNSVPFVRIRVRRNDDSYYEARLFPIGIDPTGSVRQQIERYHLLDNNGDLFLIQHRVFERLFLSLDYFME